MQDFEATTSTNCDPPTDTATFCSPPRVKPNIDRTSKASNGTSRVTSTSDSKMGQEQETAHKSSVDVGESSRLAALMAQLNRDNEMLMELNMKEEKISKRSSRRSTSLDREVPSDTSRDRVSDDNNNSGKRELKSETHILKPPMATAIAESKDSSRLEDLIAQLNRDNEILQELNAREEKLGKKSTQRSTSLDRDVVPLEVRDRDSDNNNSRKDVKSDSHTRTASAFKKRHHIKDLKKQSEYFSDSFESSLSDGQLTDQQTRLRIMGKLGRSCLSKPSYYTAGDTAGVSNDMGLNSDQDFYDFYDDNESLIIVDQAEAGYSDFTNGRNYIAEDDWIHSSRKAFEPSQSGSKADRSRHVSGRKSANENNNLNQLMAKLDQDNRVLAQLDRSLIDATLGRDGLSGHGYGAQHDLMMHQQQSAYGPSAILDRQLLEAKLQQLQLQQQQQAAAAAANQGLIVVGPNGQLHSIQAISNINAAPPGMTLNQQLIQQQKSELEKLAEQVVDSIEIPNRGRCKVFIAKYSYDPFKQSPNENPESELTISAGDFMLIFGDMDEDGYFSAELLDGRRGLVPSNFITKLTGEDLFEFQATVLYGSNDEPVINTESSNVQIERGSRAGRATAVGPSMALDAQSDSGFPPEFYDVILNDAMGHTNFQHLLAPEDFHRMNDYVELAESADIDEEDLSDLERAQAVASRDPVPPPKRLIPERQLHKSILIGWLHPDCPKGFIDSYQIYVDGVLKCSIPSNERTKALVEGVDSSIPHRISVRAVTPVGRMSKDAACTIVIGKNVPFAPCCVKATNITSESSLISWLPCNSNFYHVVAVNSVEVKTVGPSTYKHLITGLSANTLYRVSVRAKPGKLMLLSENEHQKTNPKKMEMLTTFVDFRTLPKSLPDPPVDVQVESGPQEGTLLVTWLPVTLDTFGTSHGCPVTGYAVFAAHKKLAEIDSPTGDHALLDVTQIESFHKKAVTVRTKSGENLSQDSMPCDIPDDLIKFQAHRKVRQRLVSATSQSYFNRQQQFNQMQSSSQAVSNRSFFDVNFANQGPHQFYGVLQNQMGEEVDRESESDDRRKMSQDQTSQVQFVDQPGSQQMDQYQSQMQRAAIARRTPRQQQPLQRHIDQQAMQQQQMAMIGQQPMINPQTGQPVINPQTGQPVMVPSGPHVMGQQRPQMMGHQGQIMPGQMQPGMVQGMMAGQTFQQQQMMGQQRMMQPGMQMQPNMQMQGGIVQPGMQHPGQMNQMGQAGHMGQMAHSGQMGHMNQMTIPSIEITRGTPGITDHMHPYGSAMGMTNAPPPSPYGPSSLGRPIGQPSQLKQTTMTDFERQHFPGQQGRGMNKTMVRWFVALYDYDPLTMSPNPDGADEELPFREGDLIKVYGDKDADGFYRGELAGRLGYVPCNMVSEVQQDPITGLPVHDVYGQIPPGSKKMIALYDYDPQELSPNPDAEMELAFMTGDVIYVFGEMDEDGFYLGELNGFRGLVPSNFLTEAPPDASPHRVSHSLNPCNPRPQGQAVSGGARTPARQQQLQPHAVDQHQQMLHQQMTGQQPIINPQTGQPMINPQTGQPMMTGPQGVMHQQRPQVLGLQTQMLPGQMQPGMMGTQMMAPGQQFMPGQTFPQQMQMQQQPQQQQTTSSSLFGGLFGSSTSQASTQSQFGQPTQTSTTTGGGLLSGLLGRGTNQQTTQQQQQQQMQQQQMQQQQQMMMQQGMTGQISGQFPGQMSMSGTMPGQMSMAGAMPGQMGTMGAQGQMSSMGLQGQMGTMGVQGQMGTLGNQGQIGISGAMSSHSNLPPGSMASQMTGMTSQGMMGQQGMGGQHGVTGQPGMTGQQGMMGQQGMAGPQGMSGQQGMPGQQGYGQQPSASSAYSQHQGMPMTSQHPSSTTSGFGHHPPHSQGQSGQPPLTPTMGSLNLGLPPHSQPQTSMAQQQQHLQQQQQAHPTSLGIHPTSTGLHPTSSGGMQPNLQPATTPMGGQRLPMGQPMNQQQRFGQPQTSMPHTSMPHSSMPGHMPGGMPGMQGIPGMGAAAGLASGVTSGLGTAFGGMKSLFKL